jgi:hypothetical protein
MAELNPHEKQLREALAQAIQFATCGHVPAEIVKGWHALLDDAEATNYHLNAVEMGAPLKAPDETRSTVE